MKDETDPIAEDECLLRRVRVEKFRTTDVPIISPNAFEPRVKGRDTDADGISLYRRDCLNDPAEILAHLPPEKRNVTGIVGVTVREITRLGMTVRIAPDPDIKGHVVIPELNASAYATDKSAFTHIKLALAEAASENIVRWPDSELAG